MCWDARPILDFVFSHKALIIKQYCACSLNPSSMQPVSLPFLHQTMLRGATRNFTNMTPLNTVQGSGNQIQELALNCPNTFLNDCSLVAATLDIWITLKESRPIFSTFFPTSGDFGITKKPHIFLITQVKFHG